MNKLLLMLAFFSLLFVNKLSAQTDILVGGNMENMSLWQTSLLNTATGFEPVATWNNVTNVPTNGLGGNLHVTGTTTAGNSQYCIYQEVDLLANKLYAFDAAFKAVQINNSWCEVFIGPKPTDGVDYTDQIGTRLAAFGTWASFTKADGLFSSDIDPGNYKKYSPETDGVYYIVVKMGSTSWDASSQTFEIVVDELSLIEDDSAPVANFLADATEGFLPFIVNFTDKSKFATEWSWDFGDGNTSTQQNPSHTYTTEGNYTVSLKVTNSLGEDTETKTNMIKVNPMQVLSAGGLIVDGEMEDGVSHWSFSYLNTAVENQPIATWNELVKKPSAGKGGALNVVGNAPGGQNVQYCIYQKVTLSKEKVYTFNAAFKDFSANLNQAWCEVFIGNLPVDGLDYSKDAVGNFLIADFSTWSTECNPKGYDGTFELKACGGVKPFTPAEDGDYYFVLKLGSWEGGAFDMSIDEISLIEERTKPVPAFSADKTVGFMPLTVNFTDASKFATSWSWNFGDGSEPSTDQNPSHVYSNAGSYNVTLTATNEIGSNELVKTAYIKVNEKPSLPEGQMLYGGNMEDPNLWNITQLNSNSVTTDVWNYRDASPSAGAGGNLHITASVTNATSNYCIWQEVELTAGKQYTFTAAFKDLTANLDHFWSEVYIDPGKPVDNADYTKDNHKLIAFFNTWDCGSVSGLDGTYQDDACGTAPVGVYIPTTSGTYYFVMKTGVTDWENKVFECNVLIDEVSLMESEMVQASFFADVTSGDAPLSVTFFDQSTNATSWAWDFGDGGTSTDKNPSYVYKNPGTYTVSLVASNGGVSDTETVTNLITVTGTNSIEDISFVNKISVYPNPSNGLFNLTLEGISESTIEIYNIQGKKILSKIQENEEVLSFELQTEGIYFVKIINNHFVETKKVVVKKSAI